MKPVNYPLSDMIRMDLEAIAESLTKRDGNDHKETLFSHYEIGCWNFVNAYIDEFNLLNPIQPRTDTIRGKISQYLSKVLSWLSEVKLWDVR